MAKTLFDLNEEILKDENLVQMLDYSLSFEELLKLYRSDDFLVPDDTMDVPFFAVTRDYSGAVERNNPKSKWIIKHVDSRDENQFRLAMVSYFVNFHTGNTSAPTIITRIDGETFRASKLMDHTEQLSGAPYLEDKRMRAQLAKDLINSWVFFDEDRNPNNYLIYYTKNNFPVVVAIDFSNIDLETSEMKIKGIVDTFGWERHGKTRYMTPLKTELLYHYSWEFFEERFRRFESLDGATLQALVGEILADGKAGEKRAARVAENILERVAYVRSYFKSWFDDPERIGTLRKRTVEEMHDEYSIMGRTFIDLQKDYENE